MAATWTDKQDERLKRFYEAYAGDVLPVTEIANLLGHSPGAVRYRAHKLGLTEPNRPRAQRGRTAAAVPPKACVHCKREFTPGKPTQMACSRSCAAKQRGRGGGRGRRSQAKTGKRADLGNMFFRSAWEANYARYLNRRLALGEIECWEYEPRSFPFPVQRGNKSYTPDFFVVFDFSHYEWHEVKGWMDKDSEIKLRRFAQHYAEEAAVLVLIDRTAYQAIAKEYAEDIEGWE